MCGRYDFDDASDIFEINKILEEINSRLNNSSKSSYKTGEIFPTNNVPIISSKDKKLDASIMKWGFPKWDGKGVIINAKSETCASKKFFSKPLFEKRCVVPSTGFYEWKKIDDSKNKDKYLFTMNNGPMLYMCGLYDLFKIDAIYVPCFVILTRDANSYIDDIHNRMPVILNKNEIENWLFDDEFVDAAFNNDKIILNRKKILPKLQQISI